MRTTIFTVLFLCAISIFAQQTAPTRVVNAALFKNGYGCIVREVTIAGGDNKETIIDDVPAPVHGTFWLIPSQDVTLTSITATEGEYKRQLTAISLLELLQANVGENIEVKTADGWIAGKLLTFAEVRKPDNNMPPNIPTDNNSPYYGYNRSYNPTSSLAMHSDVGNLLTIETAEGTIGLPMLAVTQIRKRPGTGALKTTISHVESGAIFKIKTSGKGGTAQIAYITRGLSWAPSYRLDIGGQLAHLNAKAVLINDAEDIVTDDLSCVAGYPNIKFAQVVDPLAMQGDIGQFISQLQTPENNQSGRSNVMTQQVMMNSAYNSSPSYPTMNANPDDDKDLHFYSFKGINIKRGERVYLPLLEMNVPFTDIYKWDIATTRDYNGYGWRNQNDQNSPPQSEDVWHTIRFKNNDKQVLTTGPVTIVSTNVFLGQNVLYYTSAGGYTDVNITKAVDIKAKSTEEILESKDNITINNNSYQIYINRGKMTVNNYKQENVKVVIKKDIYGDITYTSIKPTAINEKPIQYGVNAITTAVWEVTVPAGKSFEIEYKYSKYSVNPIPPIHYMPII